MHWKIKGFTLPEFLVAVGILTITLAIAAPAFSAMQERARVTRVLHLMTGTLATARVEAVRRNRFVSICPSANGTSCQPNSIWNRGWLVFVDADRAGQPGSPGDILQVFEGQASGLAFQSTAGRRFVRFSPSGWSAGSNLTLRLCSSSSRRLLAQVVVNNAGRVRSERIGQARPCPFDP